MVGYLRDGRQAAHQRCYWRSNWRKSTPSVTTVMMKDDIKEWTRLNYYNINILPQYRDTRRTRRMTHSVNTDEAFYRKTINFAQNIYVCMYTVRQKKLCHYTFIHNFDKCWAIFQILSLLYSPRNLQRMYDGTVFFDSLCTARLQEVSEWNGKVEV